MLLPILQVVFISLALISALGILIFGLLKNLRVTRVLSLATGAFYLVFSLLLVININFEAIVLVEVAYIINFVFSIFTFIVTLIHFIKKQ